MEGKIKAMVAVVVDLEVDDGWHRSGDHLARGVGVEADSVLFDQGAVVEYLQDVLTGQETGDPPWRATRAVGFPRDPGAHVIFEGHMLRLVLADKMDANDPRSFARAVCSCGDYTSSVDSPQSATRAWVQHWLARLGGVGR